MADYRKFKVMHTESQPLILGNCWNVQSAIALEKAGYHALGTSSAAIAESLGFQDGEDLSFEEYLFIIKRICSSTDLPVSVDMESGYGKNTEEIFSNILKLSELGVVGINIEDSLVENGERRIMDAKTFSEKMKEIIQKLKRNKVDIFVNFRSDVFLLGMNTALAECKKRISLFEQAGADGIFLPGLTEEKTIQEITCFTQLPVNLMCMPDLPDFEILKNLNVKRISSGNFLNSFIYSQLQQKAREILSQQSFKPIF